MATPATEQKAPPPAKRKPLLSISLERPTVEIDDIEYELRLIEEFSSNQHHDFSHDSDRYDALYRKPNLKPAERKRLDALLDKLFEQILVKPAEMREDLGDKLTGVIQRELLLTFTNAPSLMQLAKAQKEIDETASEDEEPDDLSTTES